MSRREVDPPGSGDPVAQIGGDACFADPRIADRELPIALEHGLEGFPGGDLAEIYREAQLREPVCEPAPEGAIGLRFAVGHVVVQMRAAEGRSEWYGLGR